MIEILSDRSNPNFPVLRDYRLDSKLQRLGTVCSIIMELKTRTMSIRKGNHATGDFVTYPAI
jgi:hypothetical protein